MKPRHAVTLCAALLGLIACSGRNEEPSVTVGVVPINSGTDTLLPVLADTVPPDNTVTIAPDTMFRGDPCSSLVEADFGSVTFAGASKGRLDAATRLSEDTCGYDVRAGTRSFTVVVQVESADGFDHPVATAQEIDQLTGIGDEAIGVRRGDDLYEVIVHVSNGYFSVSAPDKASARALAVIAVGRALAA
ncbi:MAG: hypothetical protein WCC60_05060 [Ilumatobacteraceae bacterium]